jgi:radical SAM superfamily enzyme YgiQ (UPF0313 family)
VFTKAHQRQIKCRLAQEEGPSFTLGGRRLALVYPATYRAAMSSLGFQQVLRLLRGAGISAERCFVPDNKFAGESPRTYETSTPLSAFPLIAVSMSYELELAPLIRLLDDAKIPLLHEERGAQDPTLLLGGPLTFANPLPAAPFVDAMLIGEADDTIVPAAASFFESKDRSTWLDSFHQLPGAYVPERDGSTLPPIGRASTRNLPAQSMIIAQDTAFPQMFLVEGERGCHRQCSFCVMRRSGPGMRVFDAELILSLIPPTATKVGLVGAGISDHPQIVELLEQLVGRDKKIGISSLRADRLAHKPAIASLLRQSGTRTLTVALDAASQRLRQTINKGIDEEHLLECAKQARHHRFEQLKVYLMVGLPGETRDDLDEFTSLAVRLSKLCRTTVAIAPFVAKHNTPLANEPFAGISELDARLSHLKRAIKGRVRFVATSTRWAWLEHQIAQGCPETGLAIRDACRQGGKFRHYQKAL